MGKILGIDLGTTNSCMAVMDHGEAKVIPNAEGNRTTPSIVAFTKSGERLVGQTAKRQAVTNPKNTIFSVKRFMGRKFAEAASDREKVPYELVEAKNGDVAIKVGDKSYSPPEISAMILQKLKADAEAPWRSFWANRWRADSEKLRRGERGCRKAAAIFPSLRDGGRPRVAPT